MFKVFAVSSIPSFDSPFILTFSIEKDGTKTMRIYDKTCNETAHISVSTTDSVCPIAKQKTYTVTVTQDNVPIRSYPGQLVFSSWSSQFSSRNTFTYKIQDVLDGTRLQTKGQYGVDFFGFEIP